MTIEGDSALSVFGQVKEAVSNVIVAEVGLPVNALYDGANEVGLLELWEPSADPDNIYVQLADYDDSANADYGGLNLTDAYKAAAKRLARGFERVLCGAFDCSNAVPFNASKYAGIEEYTKQRDFARVALGAFAHYLFGHVDATSAITNDVAFIRDMLSLSKIDTDASAVKTAATTEHNWNGTKLFSAQAASEGANLRYAKYAKGGVSGIINSKDYTATEWGANSSGDANLACRLVQSIMKKGHVNTDVSQLLLVPAAGSTDGDALKVMNSLTGDAKKAALAYIVAQVVGQDATRLMNADNSERTKDVHQLLRFYEGDVIYVNIKVKTPTVSVGAGQAVGATTFQNSYDEQTYTLKITLEAEDTTVNSA